ncbi:MAG: LPS export ABC transporter periplasmic protein LptC [Candidatus Cloacimonetes bacterium]|jgi:LPS export ABC transporter protein LptC|nr:LPS export ABC transporter periplasmic protein LptC [Candidatus Cloacimonadota bacterium]MDD4805991.1 LPS export ABC transporter periplasmic protein LptC [Candidatus Cloacimonadota bacterium]
MKPGCKILLLLPLLFALSCKQEELNKQTPTMERGLPDETSLNVKLNEYKDERLEYIIEAAKMERYTDRRMMYAYKVTLSSYDHTGSLSSVIKADTTIVDDARNMIFASGKASYKTPEGTISTSRIVWDRNFDEITAPAYVELLRSGDVLRGRNLRTDSKLSYAEMEEVTAEGIFDEKDYRW